MINKINNTIKNYSMAKKEEGLLLCVSGGPDSIAMLHAFISIAKDMHLRLFIVHVNHSLRGIESDKDQRYVENTAKALNIPVICSKVNTIEFSKSDKISVEAAARKLRYDFFIQTAKRLKIKTIATAHTKDDQAETILMRLIRGAGPRGLCGIPVINHINDIKIIRPLIDISRKEVLEYLSSEKIRPRIDLSNTSIKFFRNKIRLKLIPAFEREYNHDIKNVFSSLAELMQGDFEYLEYVYKKTFKQLAKIKKRGEIVFRLCDIKSKPVSIKRGLIRNAIEFLCGGLDNIEYRHWKEIESLIGKRPAGSVVSLPNNISIKKTKKSLSVYLCKVTKPGIEKQPISILKIPSKVFFGRHMLHIAATRHVPDFSGKPKKTEYIHLKVKDFPLILRTYRQGDSIKPLGMQDYKKVSDIFIDDKIPLSRRKNIPILASCSGEILCIFGVRVSEACRIRKNTKQAIKLELLTR